MRHEPVEDAAEPCVKAALIWVDPARRIALYLDLDEVGAVERRDHDRGNPAEDERRRDDGKERAAKLTCHAFGKGDGNEARTGDQRACQHRARRRLEGVTGGVEAVHAHLELDAHHLNRDDRVVDKKPERNDERAKRNLVQRNPRRIHKDEDAEQDEGNAARDDKSRADAE